MENFWENFLWLIEKYVYLAISQTNWYMQNVL